MPETTALPLAPLADLHRNEVTAEEDVYRTLPFVGAALGADVVAVLALPRHAPMPHNAHALSQIA